MIRLREAVDADFVVLLEHQRDQASTRMAAFGTLDPDAATFAARMRRAITDEATVQRVVLEGDAVIGFIGTYRHQGALEVTYRIARSHWGRGIATLALQQLLREVKERPLYASTAGDNLGSQRVLEKCGFVRTKTERSFAEARGVEIDEVFFALHQPSP